MSPIREFLDLHREYAIVSYWTSNMVPYEPPADKQQEADRYRYEPANSHLPWAVRRIYKRAWHDHRAPVIAKWSVQLSHNTHVALITQRALQAYSCFAHTLFRLSLLFTCCIGCFNLLTPLSFSHTVAVASVLRGVMERM